MLILLLLASTVGAISIHVPQDQPTIQVALNGSAVGDVILVSPGAYEGNITFPPHAVELRSVGGPASTVLIASSGSVVTFQNGQSNATVIEGFSITGGTGTPATVNGRFRGGVGGGIICRNNSNPIIRENWIYGNTAIWPTGLGGGIFNWSSHPLIEGNWIHHNEAHFGGGLFMFYSSSIVRDNIFESNTTQYGNAEYGIGKGGGIRVFMGNSQIDGNTFVGNYCHGGGSGVALSELGTQSIIRRNLMVGNINGLAIEFAYGASGQLGCNMLWSNQPSNSWPSPSYWTNLGGNSVTDPILCDSAWPWRVSENSPCLPGQNPQGPECGWIGATRSTCNDVVEADESLPESWSLGDPWPNPFNPTTRFLVSAAELGWMKLQVFNMRGDLVMQLHDGLLEAGAHDFQIDGSGLPSGIYLLRLQAEGFSTAQRLILLR
jgi:hypothetical protein